MSKTKSVRFAEDVSPTDKALLRMSKRRRDDNEGGDDIAYSDIGRRLEPRPGEKQNAGDSKHTLDSDEEEDEKYDRLNVADVEGQEDATVDFDDETKITPFNMNDEMDEGHFDADGTFIFNKKKEDIHDAWLDNIDWAKIKKDAGGLWQGEGPDADDEDLSRSPTGVDRSDIYQNILQFLQPHETITKALKRLGGSRTTSDVRQARWKEKKSMQPLAAVDEPKDEAKVKDEQEDRKPSTSADPTPLPLDENATAVTKLTELVDRLVDEGEFEVYGYTYEKISHDLEKIQKQRAVKGVDSGARKAAAADDDALDMFADEIDTQRLRQQDTATLATENKEAESLDQKTDTQASDDVRWEFKWKNEDEAEVFGPCTSQQMQQWTDDGYFKDGVWVRRIGQENAAFYNSKRIDFELYI